MNVLIEPSKVKGEVVAPPSKSYTIRGLMCAALARGVSEIVHPLTSEDTDAAARVLRQVGVEIEPGEDVWRVHGGVFRTPKDELHCGDSAATMRFMTAICSLVPGESRLVAGQSLAKRPVKTLVDALRQVGVSVACSGDVPPVTVKGGRLRGGTAELPGDISSQFVSALLLIAPFAEQGMTIRLTTPLESKPYVLMTLECLKNFGIEVNASEDLTKFIVRTQSYKPTRYKVEGDWSSASYFLALGAVSDGVKIANLNSDSLQGDKRLLDFLRDMGASVNASGNSVVVKKSKLKAIRADLSDCIDLLPTVAVLAAVADGVSELTGIARARIKESNRVTAVREGLEKMGIKTAEERDKLVISGGEPHGATIDSKNDHRIAMAFSIPGMLVGNTTIAGAECVNKTFPQFWDILESIGGRIKRDGQ